MSTQPDVARLSPELVQGVTGLARTLVAAVRNWTLYPQEHPAVRASFDRFSQAIHHATNDAVFSVGITPSALMIEGHEVPFSPQVAEAARLLHDRDLLQLTFSGIVPPEAVAKLLALLTLDGAALREGGGPERLWSKDGHRSISLEQIDYGQVLEDKDETRARRHDDVWKSIVYSIVSGQKAMDEISQQRLLDIAGDPGQIGDLAGTLIASKCAADGSPMITTQAATVVAAFRHLVGIVSVKAGHHAADAIRNIAAATVELEPHVAMEIMRTEEDPRETVQVVRGIAAAFDDVKVARLLATALAVDGQASGRLAEVFDTIAPDPERKRRVLSMAQALLSESAFGQKHGRQFKAIWSSMEELLVSYNDSPFVSAEYRSQLDGAAARGEAAAFRDLPEELPEWMETLGQQNVRRLSVVLIADLLKLEIDPARAAEIASDMTALAEDLLMSGDYAEARDVSRVLHDAAADERFAARDACRDALAGIARLPAMKETVAVLGELEDAHLALFSEMCRLIGPASVDALASTLTSKDGGQAQSRSSEIIVSFGGAAVPHLAALAEDERTHVQCSVAALLGRIGAADAVPLLQPMLRHGGAAVTRAAVVALMSINDPAAARAIHTVLRAVEGERRRIVVAALVEGRDARVVPVLARILNESDPLGKDHAVVLDTLGALRLVHTDGAVRAVEAVMRRRRWFTPSRNRALKRAAVETLVAIGTDAATQALDRAATNGDRVLRKLAKARLAGVER